MVAGVQVSLSMQLFMDVESTLSIELAAKVDPDPDTSWPNGPVSPSRSRSNLDTCH